MQNRLINHKTVKLAEERDFEFKTDLEENLIYPDQSLLQKWLRETHNVQIDMFYEDELHSGRVQRIADPDKRWKSASSKTYEDTLEIMLYHGLLMISDEWKD